MSKKSDKDDDMTTTEPKASKTASGATIREEKGKQIYSVGKTDLISRDLEVPHAYTVLVDCPPYRYRAGEVKVLSMPYDESAEDTVRDMAKALELA